LRLRRHRQRQGRQQHHGYNKLGLHVSFHGWNYPNRLGLDPPQFAEPSFVPGMATIFRPARERKTAARLNNSWPARRSRQAVLCPNGSPQPKSLRRGTRPKDQPMLTFQIIGGIFALLFLAAAMTGIEGTGGR
jgi:hypothetical protein